MKQPGLQWESGGNEVHGYLSIVQVDEWSAEVQIVYPGVGKVCITLAKDQMDRLAGEFTRVADRLVELGDD